MGGILVMQDGSPRRAADLAGLDDGDGRGRAVEVAGAGRGLEVALKVHAGRVHRLQRPRGQGSSAPMVSELGRRAAGGVQRSRTGHDRMVYQPMFVGSNARYNEGR